MSMNDGLKTEILEELTSELEKESTFDSSFLRLKVNSAYREIKRIRNYPPYYTAKQIEDDMEKYFDVIKNLALYDYTQRGIEFQSQNTENSVTTQFVRRGTILKGIISLSL